MPATRSPGAKPEPSGASTTTPAASPPVTNGGGVANWYSPRLCSRSGNATPAAWTSISSRSSPASGCAPSGSGKSASASAVGPVERGDDDRSHHGRTSTTTLPTASRRSSTRSASAPRRAAKRRADQRLDPALGGERCSTAALTIAHRARATPCPSRPSRRRCTVRLRSSSRLTFSSGIEPPVKPTTASRPPIASERSESRKRSPPTGSTTRLHAAAAGERAHLVEPVAGRAHDLVGAHRARRRAPSRRTRRPRSTAPSAAKSSSAAVPTPPAAPWTSTVSPGVNAEPVQRVPGGRSS